MIINNHHPENIIVVVDNTTYQLSAHSSIKITTARSFAYCQLIHNHIISDWNDKLSDKIIMTVSKMTAIIVDSKYIISEIQEDSVIDITNEIVAYEKYDACILYFGVVAKKAKIELKDCYSPNAKNFLAARKLLLLSDFNDFPIISPIISTIRYNRIKKLTSQNNLWNIVFNKTSFTQ